MTGSTEFVILESSIESTRRDRRIKVSPEIMEGKPVIRGTRIPVELVLSKLRAGISSEAILLDHPRLTQDDIRAAQAFAAAGCRGQ